jgi:phosphatidylglycerol:prolipoprotein diacylglycerol transferase
VKGDPKVQGVKISFPMLGDRFVLDPPTHFNVFGRPVYWYAVIIALGFILAAAYLMKRRQEFGLTQDNILDMFLVAVPCGIVGARLYYVVFNPAGFFGPGEFVNILKVWEGGLAIYGGIIAAAAGMYILSRRRKIPIGVLFDVGGLGLLIGQTIGRWGNFINREAYGAETALPWKMGLTSGSETVYVHPTFLYESLWNLTGFVLIHIFSKKYRKYDGQIFLMYLAWYGFGRFFIEGLRTDSLYLMNTDIRTSQLVAALSFGAAAYFLLRNRLRKTPSEKRLYVERAAEATAAEAEIPATDTDDKEKQRADGAAKSKSGKNKKKNDNINGGS